MGGIKKGRPTGKGSGHLKAKSNQRAMYDPYANQLYGDGDCCACLRGRAGVVCDKTTCTCHEFIGGSNVQGGSSGGGNQVQNRSFCECHCEFGEMGMPGGSPVVDNSSCPGQEIFDMSCGVDTIPCSCHCPNTVGPGQTMPRPSARRARRQSNVTSRPTARTRNRGCSCGWDGWVLPGGGTQWIENNCPEGMCPNCHSCGSDPSYCECDCVTNSNWPQCGNYIGPRNPRPSWR